ncbi:MAG: hypothetical protein P8Y58_00355 [Novosphingobium sp.]
MAVPAIGKDGIWSLALRFGDKGQGSKPLYVQTSGRAEPGERIRFAVRLEGLRE